MSVTTRSVKVERARLEVPLDPTLKAKLRAAARTQHLTMSAATRAAIEAFVAAAERAARLHNDEAPAREPELRGDSQSRSTSIQGRNERATSV